MQLAEILPYYIGGMQRLCRHVEGLAESRVADSSQDNPAKKIGQWIWLGPVLYLDMSNPQGDIQQNFFL
jgi:hypothetical protein